MVLPLSAEITQPASISRSTRARDGFLERLDAQPHIHLVPGQEWRGSRKSLQMVCTRHDHSYQVMTYNFCTVKGGRTQGTGCKRCSEEIAGKANRARSERHLGQTFGDNLRVEALEYRAVKDASKKNGIQQVAFASGTCLHCGGRFSGIMLRHIVQGNTTSCGCRDSAFDTHAPAFLYYVRVERYPGQPLYKVGVTSRCLHARFTRNARAKMVSLWEHACASGAEAKAYEKLILDQCEEHRYKGPAILGDRDGGNTELFTVDVLNMDASALIVPIGCDSLVQHAMPLVQHAMPAEDEYETPDEFFGFAKSRELEVVAS